MKTAFAVVLCMLAIDGLGFTLFPGPVKRLVEALTPRELRAVGAIEMLVVLAGVYYLITSA